MKPSPNSPTLPLALLLLPFAVVITALYYKRPDLPGAGLFYSLHPDPNVVIEFLLFLLFTSLLLLIAASLVATIRLYRRLPTVFLAGLALGPVPLFVVPLVLSDPNNTGAPGNALIEDLLRGVVLLNTALWLLAAIIAGLALLFRHRESPPAAQPVAPTPLVPVPETSTALVPVATRERLPGSPTRG